MGAERGSGKEDMTGIETVIEMMIDIEIEGIGEVVAEKEVKEGGMSIMVFYCS